METKSVETLVFENRAWEKAEYPRLHMKDPERFKITEIQNSKPIEKEVHLAIGYHHGESQRLHANKWYLDIETYEYKNCYGETKIFSSLKDIKEYIQEKFSKIAIFPERWN